VTLGSSLVEAEKPVVAEIRRARWAVLGIFLLNGVGVASWAAHIPFIKEKFGLNEATLGLALLAIAAGSVGTLLLGGPIVARFGSRMMTLVGAFVFCADLPLLIVAPTFPLLILALVCFGACLGAMEVAANVQAFGIEERYARPIMSTFHALFSVGGLLGAAVAGWSLAEGIPPITHMLIVALVLGVLTAAGMRHLLPTDKQHPSEASGIILPSGPRLGLGVLAFFALVAEGAMADWSAVYLRDTLLTTAGFAATGYATFSLAMAVGRLSGDAIRTRLHSRLVVQISAAMAAVGMGTALFSGQPLIALIGFACVGLGLANIVPVLFTAAGRTPGVATGTGIAAVATAGYFGFLIGPPMIGFVAQHTSLTGGLALVALSLALTAGLAGQALQATE
jgi:predicted MFS family arabinose efflux permease